MVQKLPQIRKIMNNNFFIRHKCTTKIQVLKEDYFWKIPSWEGVERQEIALRAILAKTPDCRVGVGEGNV
jgi:hypothetical protein